jgi:ArsR family transcriptional regulator
VETNVLSRDRPEEQISRLLSFIGQPSRIQILLVIGVQEACVCHFEAVLGLRQASISQHLMVLRKAQLVTAQRDGRNIFYRLARPAVLQLIDQAAAVLGLDPRMMQQLALRPHPDCPCPQCNPGVDPAISCQNIKIIAKC